MHPSNYPKQDLKIAHCFNNIQICNSQFHSANDTNSRVFFGITSESFEIAITSRMSSFSRVYCKVHSMPTQ